MQGRAPISNDEDGNDGVGRARPGWASTHETLMQRTSNLPTLFQGALPSQSILSGARLEPYRIDGLLPSVAVFPASEEQVSAVLSACHAEGLAVAPWGGGTRMGLGNPPARYDVALVLTGLDRILEYEPEDLTATVQSGITLAGLDAVFRKEGQFLPLDPPRRERTTLGGVQASLASGPLRHRYGTARDMTIGIRVVHADGVVTKAGGKVVKNVTGYDMNKLYIGSLGTLGVIVEASLKVMPEPAAEGALTAFFPTAAAACEAALGIMATPLDAAFLSVAAGGALQGLAGDTRKDAKAALAVGAHGQAVSVARVLRDAGGICAENGSVQAESIAAGGVASLRGALADAACEGAPLLAARVGVRPADVGAVLDSLAELSGGYGFDWAAVAHVSHGIVHLGWRPGENGAAAHALASFVEEARATASGRGGYLVLESAPPDVKALVDPWADAGSGLSLMRSLKQQFDPTGVLNPGRFVGAI